MNYWTTSNIKIRNLIETFTDAFNEKLKYSQLKYHQMGIDRVGATIKYNDVEFYIEEYSSTDCLTGKWLHRIIISPPRNMDIKVASVAWTEGDTMMDAIDARLRACRQMAEFFVEEILPKVDFEIEKAVYEKNIDKILSVLDGPSYKFNNLQNG